MVQRTITLMTKALFLGSRARRKIELALRLRWESKSEGGTIRGAINRSHSE
jgi:hypothetical protein